jgi:hypothetical protein
MTERVEEGDHVIWNGDLVCLIEEIIDYGLGDDHPVAKTVCGIWMGQAIEGRTQRPVTCLMCIANEVSK